jgi:phenylacetate-CoA ligase
MPHDGLGEEAMIEQKKPSMLDRIVELLKTVEHFQWYTQIRMQRMQTGKLKGLVAHHVKENPWFAQRIKSAGLQPRDISVDQLQRLPLLKRRDIQTAKEDFFAKTIPEDHGKPGIVKTSGSTGEPVVIKATDLVSIFYHVCNIIEIMWNNRNPESKLAVIRAGQFTSSEYANWGMPINAIVKTGPLLAINISEDIRKQVEMLEKFGPEMLVVYPNNLAALMDLWTEKNNAPKLKHLKTVGETVSDSLRDRARAMFGLEIEDSYSSQELGTIANQCYHGTYHTMDFNLIVEVLDDAGNPVAEGETGRVVVTDLHNYASPMVRYDIGDYAVRGGTCSCGRGLLTLTKIIGRERNLILRADGSRYWPMVGMYQFDELDFIIRRYQVIQHDRTDMEYRIVTDNPITPEQEAALIAIAQKALGPEFKIRVTRQAEDFPVNPNGKFEEFVCRAA